MHNYKIIKSLKNNLITYTFCILSICLYLGILSVTLSIILLTISSIIFFNKQNIKNKFNSPIILIALIFIIYLISSFYSTNKDIAYSDILQKLSLLIFPVIYIINNFKKINILIILKTFVFTSSAFASFLIIRTFYLYLINNSYYMFYENFSYYLHPTYLSMYFLFALSVVFYLLFKAKQNKNIKILLLISSITIITGILFCESKISYFILLILIVFSTIILWKKIQNKILRFGILIIFIALSLVVYNDRRINNMIKHISNYQKVINNKNTDSSTGMRIQILLSCKNIINNNLLFGVGNGDVKKTLIDEYQKQGLNNLVKHKYNTHNQFIETFIATGIIGFGLLLLVFIIPFIQAVKYKNYLVQYFLIIIFLNFMFESMLNRQAGVVFFAFFYILLIGDMNITKHSLQKNI